VDIIYVDTRQNQIPIWSREHLFYPAPQKTRDVVTWRQGANRLPTL